MQLFIPLLNKVRLIVEEMKRMKTTRKTGKILILIERSTIDTCIFWLTSHHGTEIPMFKRKHFQILVGIHQKIIQLFHVNFDITVNYYCHVCGNEISSIIPTHNILERYRHNEFNIFLTPSLDCIVEFYRKRHDKKAKPLIHNVNFGLDTTLNYLKHDIPYKFRSPSIPPAGMPIKECIDAIFKPNDMNIHVLGPEVWNNVKLNDSDRTEVYLRQFDVFNDFFLDAHTQKMAQEKMAGSGNVRLTPRYKRPKYIGKNTSHC